MKKLIFILYIFLLASCAEEKQSNLRTITVTLEPLRFFTEAIAGDKYKVISMIPKGNRPETYDPTPQQLLELSKSDAYFRIGYIGFEQVWMEKLANNIPHLNIFDTSKGVALIRHNAHASLKSDIEPHIWNSTKNAHIIVQNICNALCIIDSINTNFYKQRTDSVQHLIAETDSLIRTYIQGANKSFLIYHPALSYFARDYGLHQLCIEEGGKEPTPHRLKSLINQCQNEKVKVIFVQQEFDTKNAQLIANELKIPIVVINPLSYEWQQEMIHIAKELSHETYH